MTTPSGYSRSDFPIIDMGDEDLQTLLEGFDDYSQKLILAIDPCWDASNRMQSVEYCLFLYGAALGIARGKQLDDEYCVAIFGPYLSRFMDWRISTPWLLQCEAEMVKSHRLQGVRSAGANTATAVILAGSQGRSDDLNSPRNMELLIQIFSELRKLIDDREASDEHLFQASGLLYDSVVGTT